MAEGAVMNRLEKLAGFAIVPGTLNVRLPRPLERDSSWRYVRAAEISPTGRLKAGRPATSWSRSRSRTATEASPFKQMSTETPNTPPIRSSS